MVQECRFIKANGLKCHSPAMRLSAFCYSHGRFRVVAPRRRRKKDELLDLPVLTDIVSFRVALNRILQAVASNTISASRAGKLLYALQMALGNLQSVPLGEELREPEPGGSSDLLPR